MKIDLFKLNNFNKIDIDQDITFDPEYFGTTGIRDIKDCHITGTLSIDVEDDLVADLEVKGTFILPCAITLEDVPYEFDTIIDDILGKFEDFYNNNKNTLDILPIIWENIVSEVPIRVVKEGIDTSNISGDGWELVSSEE